MGKPIKAYSLEDIESLLEEAHLPKFRARQLAEWLYVKNVSSYEEMTNLPKTMREQLACTHPLYTPSVVDKQISKDGTQKYVLEFEGGVFAETVAMPFDDGRLSVCCSSQSGCAMGCVFCATGKQGLLRSLEPGEIVDQVLITTHDMGKRVTNVVIMGQGEPFANYRNTMAALRILNDPKLLNIGARHITVSTCGLIPQIESFAREPEQFTLAVSLHSAVQNTRNMLIPAMRNYPLDRLKESLAFYNERTNRRFSFEYALIEGINDDAEHLDALVDYCKGLLCHVNIIMLNQVDGSPYRPASSKTPYVWIEKLEKEGIACTKRLSRGSDIDGACGQLSNKQKNRPF